MMWSMWFVNCNPTSLQVSCFAHWTVQVRGKSNAAVDSGLEDMLCFCAMPTSRGNCTLAALRLDAHGGGSLLLLLLLQILIQGGLGRPLLVGVHDMEHLKDLFLLMIMVKRGNQGVMLLAAKFESVFVKKSWLKSGVVSYSPKVV